jgi:hypothetical protein
MHLNAESVRRLVDQRLAVHQLGPVRKGNGQGQGRLPGEDSHDLCTKEDWMQVVVSQDGRDHDGG